MKHSVPHDLGRAQAKKVAEAAWTSYSKSLTEYAPACTWDSDTTARISFAVKGVSLNGILEVGDRDIAIDLDVPLLFRPFKGVALKVIEGEIRDWIAKCKRGEL